MGKTRVPREKPLGPEKRTNSTLPHITPKTHFTKARACKAIFSSSVSKNRVVYTPETSCMKGTSVHNKNMRIKQFCNNRKVLYFSMALQAQKLFPAFKISFTRAPALGIEPRHIGARQALSTLPTSEPCSQGLSSLTPGGSKMRPREQGCLPSLHPK